MFVVDFLVLGETYLDSPNGTHSLRALRAVLEDAVIENWFWDSVKLAGVHDMQLLNVASLF